MKLMSAKEAREITKTFNEKCKETAEQEAKAFIDKHIAPQIEGLVHNGKSWLTLHNVAYSNLNDFVQKEICNILSSLGYYVIAFNDGTGLDILWT